MKIIFIIASFVFVSCQNTAGKSTVKVSGSQVQISYENSFLEVKMDTKEKNKIKILSTDPASQKKIKIIANIKNLKRSQK